MAFQSKEVPEFHIGDANIAKPRPNRSNANFNPSDSFSMGAKVEAKPPMSVLICPSALLMEDVIVELMRPRSERVLVIAPDLRNEEESYAADSNERIEDEHACLFTCQCPDQGPCFVHSYWMIYIATLDIGSTSISSRKITT